MRIDASVAIATNDMVRVCSRIDFIALRSCLVTCPTSLDDFIAFDTLNFMRTSLYDLRARMMIRIRAFAIYRELLGRDVIDLDLPDGSTPRDVFEKLFHDRDDLTRLLRATMFAVNREYVDEASPLRPGDELALIPPVAGGVGCSGPRKRSAPSGIPFLAVPALAFG